MDSVMGLVDVNSTPLVPDAGAMSAVRLLISRIV
jgi:hypothetical protein